MLLKYRTPTQQPPLPNLLKLELSSYFYYSMCPALEKVVYMI